MSKRYKVKRFSSCYLMNWVDNKTNKELTALEIEEILHKQEKRIAELKKKLEEKDKLIERLQGVIDKLRDKKFAGKTLVEAVNAVYEPLFKNKCDEVEEFKQQLHDLPKKIVEYFYDEIRHRAILEDDYCPDHNLERKYGVRKCLLENIRTTILEKFGGEDESLCCNVKQ